jgi:hypothetical protein
VPHNESGAGRYPAPDEEGELMRILPPMSDNLRALRSLVGEDRFARLDPRRREEIAMEFARTGNKATTDYAVYDALGDDPDGGP